MWVIKVTFGNGTWYRGVLDSRVDEAMAKKVLLSNFSELFTEVDIKRRGGGKYRIYYSSGRYKPAKKKAKKEKKVEKVEKIELIEEILPEPVKAPKKAGLFNIFRRKA